MKKRIVLCLVSLLLLALPWQGFPGYTLLAAFVPLLLLAEMPGRVWPWVTGSYGG